MRISACICVFPLRSAQAGFRGGVRQEKTRAAARLPHIDSMHKSTFHGMYCVTLSPSCALYGMYCVTLSHHHARCMAWQYMRAMACKSQNETTKSSTHILLLALLVVFMENMKNRI